MFADFFVVLPTVPMAMCAAGVAVLLVGVLAAKNEIAEAAGLDKIVALSHLCFAVPLAVFGAIHLFGPELVREIVPPYMPWRSFWVYFVGGALIATALSVAAKVAVRWSGALFGTMMFLFVAMIHLPAAVQTHERVISTIVFRELSFGGAAWILAGSAMDGCLGQGKRTLIGVGRVLVTMALIVFGIEQLLHPTLLPGVPLRKEIPSWVPARVLIDYLTGAALLVAAGSILLRKKTRAVASSVGGWLLLMVLVIYGPVMVWALAQTDVAMKVQGINYFADTLLFAGCILALAGATPYRPGASLRKRVPESSREHMRAIAR